MTKATSSVGLALAATAIALSAHAQEIKRTYPKPDAFIASAVTVPAGYDTVYVSGIPSNVAGGTEAQTADVLAKLQKALAVEGLTFADVVNMKVYLVADPATGKMDFPGMMTAYKAQFGTPTQPNRPSRVTVQISALAQPGAMVEIELVAARKAR